MNRIPPRKKTATRVPVVRHRLRSCKISGTRKSIPDLIFSNCIQAIVLADAGGSVLSANKAFSTLTGFKAKEVVGKRLADLLDPQSVVLLDAAAKKTGEWHGAVKIEQKSGGQRTVFLTMLWGGEEKKPEQLYLLSESDNKNKSARASHIDTLTKLPNRRAFGERLSAIIDRSKSNDTFCAILILDVNRFHSINDSMGFASGDLLLQLLAQRLSSSTGETEPAFRLGSDEFALIIDNITHPEDVSLVARKILSACAPAFRISDQDIYVTFSIGISIFPGDGITIEQLLKSAHAALHRAKEFGVNQFRTYHPAMNSKAAEEFRLDNDLRKALKREELILLFQPQVDLTSGGICGAEALIRWMHPQRGVISPARFVHLAESNGLIIPIGEWVLREACRQMKKWQKLYSKNLYIAVNLSNQQFQRIELADRVAGILEETGLDPATLELEITESVGMKNPEATLKTLNTLKSMGVHVAIDDFGTGYSSIYYLKTFPIDTIKVDRSFINDMATEPNAATIVLAMIAMAKQLGLSIVAEGVENRAQLDFLIGAGCGKVQGFFYSPPVSAPAFARLLNEPEQLRNWQKR